LELEMNLANAKVGQLLIPVDDFEKGVAFYRDILGLPFLFAAPPFKFRTSMPYFHPSNTTASVFWLSLTW